MNITLCPTMLNGTVSAPPSKSLTHRALICAALSDRPCEIINEGRGEDISATLDCIAAFKNASRLYNCRESGTTLRFFVPLSLLGGGGKFIGSGRLIERGISEYERVLPEHGIKIENNVDGISVSGRLTAGEYTLRGDVSSQFVSGLLLALSRADGDSTLRVLPPVESRAYIDMTLSVMRSFGVTVTENEKNTFEIHGTQRYFREKYTVEGDWSNAAYFIALKMLGHDIEITGLEFNSIQPDKVCLEYFERLKNGCAVLDVSNCPDLAPVLMAFAAMNNGCTLTGTHRLKLKESDRARAMAEELTKFGCRIEVYDNSVDITKTKLHAPKEILSSHNDHRVAMALTLPCLEYGGTVNNAEAVNKSFGEFFEIIEELRNDRA